MTVIKRKNFFDAYTFCDLFAKIVGFQFISIQKDKIGNYFAKSSTSDILRAFAFFLFGVYMTRYILGVAIEVNSGRSVIFEIMTAINGKFQADHGFLMAIQFLILREDYFEVLRNIHLIDVKVR